MPKPYEVQANKHKRESNAMEKRETESKQKL